MLAACQKEEEPRWLEVTTESYSGSKVVVDGVASAWADGDELRVNSTCVTIHKSGDRYYIDATEANATGVNRALYPASLSATALTGDAVTITLPASYRYRTDGTGHQLIELPMAACEAAGERLCFKHLTGAMYFTIENSYGTTLQLDRLSVTSDNYCLSGSRSIDFSDLTSVEPDDEGGEADHTVSLLFDDVSLGDGESLTVIIPIAPVGADNHFTVSVSAHHEGTRYTYSRTQSTGGALARNQLGYATTDIETGENVTTGALFELSTGEYLISSPKDFVTMVDAINNSWSYSGNNYKALNYKITSDIDMSGYAISPISGYTGTSFDGGGHTISNLTINGITISTNGYCALFKNLRTAISNITLNNITLNYTGNTTHYIAPLVCTTDGAIKLTACNVNNIKINVSGNPTTSYYGGLIAYSGHDCKIKTCNVTSSFDISPKSGNIYFGGLAGELKDNLDTINNCTIINPSITIVGASYLYYGGIVGRLYNSTVKSDNCVWTGSNVDINASSTIYAGGVIGRMVTNSILKATYCTLTAAFTTEGSTSKFGVYTGASNTSFTASNFTGSTSSITVNGETITRYAGS